MAQPHNDEDDPLVGRLLGEQYRVLERLGEGGMGTVYLVIHIHLKKKFATKVLNAETARRPDAIARFQQEAVSASRLDHDNIVDVVNFGHTEDGVAYLVMEYLTGKTLNQVLSEKIALTIDDAVRVAVPICRALAAAHGAGIVHRDLKPENVFVQRKAVGKQQIKLLDFGVSKIKETHFKNDRKLTQTGDVLGSPLYMSPEASKGSADLDARADLYAIGVMLYEMCTGMVPFTAENYLQVLYQHISQPPRPPKELRRDLPDALDQVILRAMAKEPADRYQTAEELEAAILAAAPDVNVDAPIDIGTPSAPMAAQPLPKGMISLTPPPLPAPLPVATPSAQIKPTAPAPVPAPAPAPVPANPNSITLQTRAEEPRARVPWPWIALTAVALAGAVAVGALLASRRDPEPGRPGEPPVATPVRGGAGPDAGRSEAEVAGEEATAAAAAKAAGTGEVELSVDSTPRGATVFLDGQAIGATPLHTSVPRDGREHTVKVELAGHRPETRTVVLDGPKPIAVALERATAKPQPPQTPKQQPDKPTSDIKEGR